MKQITTILLAGTTAMFMNACGGGGGGSTPAEPNTNVYDLRTFIDIPNYTINGEGTITAPAGTLDVTGSYQVIYNGPDTIPDAHAHEVIMNLSGGATTINQEFYNITYMGNIISTFDRNSEVTCETPLALDTLPPVPTDATVGYASGVLTLNCSDGTYKTFAIELNDAGGGNADLSIISKTYAQGGALEGSETDILTVTPDMSLINASVTGSIPVDGITFSLYSTSITQP